MLALRVLEEGEDREQGDASKRQVAITKMSDWNLDRFAQYAHPKAPSPTRPIGQHSAENGPDDRRDAEHARQHCDIDGSLPQRHREPHDRHAP